MYNTKELQSLAKRGIKNPTFKGYYIVNGIKYESPAIAAQHIPVPAMTIYRRCKANAGTNYSFEPFTPKRAAKR